MGFEENGGPAILLAHIKGARSGPVIEAAGKFILLFEIKATAARRFGLRFCGPSAEEKCDRVLLCLPGGAAAAV